ncbi:MULTISPECIES: hypothetical protein [unclassified Dietzia]|uniref:hypothetical protein n=1 Tax=unclassified Dietzia TaxID=2617939 RepID=UPI001316F81B|nr:MULTISPECIES: hypothetical protein [unclassified Dietzia]QGW24574.1 hypothetical protein GJR88_02364 [Dietzia sp. DQ12-45-1b]
MSSTPHVDDPAAPADPRRFTAWPLWAVLAGAAGLVGTVATDLRPDAEVEAINRGESHAVVPADVVGLDPAIGRVGFLAGLLAVFALMVFAAAWRRHVETLFTRSTAARVVSIGLIASAGALILGYGWRGALANYLGPEAGAYGEEGLFVYYMLTDFGAYIPWTGLIASALALAWMAWVERDVSRILGTVAAILGVGTLGAVVVSGVPGLPGILMPFWLVVTGVWLAVGRSRMAHPSEHGA